MATLSDKQSSISIKQKGTERAVTESVATDHKATARMAGAMAAKEKIDEVDTTQGSKPKEDKREGSVRFRNERIEGYFGGGGAPAVSDTKKRAKKQRLVSYSSQDSGSDTGSRRNNQKRAAVTKMGGVMIDHISRTVTERTKRRGTKGAQVCSRRVRKSRRKVLKLFRENAAQKVSPA